jgi:hypothetical protein
MGEDGRDNGCKDLLRLLEESGYEGEGWNMADGEWMIAGCTWTDMARVAEERWGNLIEAGEGRGFINLEGRRTRDVRFRYIMEYGYYEKGNGPLRLRGRARRRKSK